MTALSAALFISSLLVSFYAWGKNLKLKQMQIELNECLGDLLVYQIIADAEAKPHYDLVIRKLKDLTKTHYKE